LLIPLVLVYLITSTLCLIAIILVSNTDYLDLEVFNALYNVTAGILSIAVPLFIALVSLFKMVEKEFFCC
jgi:hypothetical protein